MQNVALPRPWLKYYPHDVPESINFPDEQLPRILTDTASKYPDSVALNYMGKTIKYRELNELSNKFANGLSDLGFKKGSKIALILPNVPQFAFCFWGALKAGLVVVPCNPLYREKEFEFQLRDSEAEGIVIMNNIVPPNNFYSEFERTRPHLENVKHVFTTSVADYLPSLKKQLAGPVKKIQTIQKPGTIDLASFISKKSGAEPKETVCNPKEDVAVLQYTGGTTGVAKGAMLTHQNLVSNAIAVMTWSHGDHKAKLLAVTPFFHTYGLTCCLIGPTSVGVEVILLPSFHVKEVLEAISKYRITTFPGVATMYIAIVNYPELGRYPVNSIKYCISGAAPLPIEVQKKFNSTTGGSLVEGYGLTEASPVTHANPMGEGALVKSGSVGIPFPNTEAKIVDIETGMKDLPVGEVGEVAVKGPQVMKGYWKRPDETAIVMRGGWLLTGDIGRMDEDGYFYIIDRKKDWINVSGFKVWPRDVEEVLYTQPDIKEAAVIGVKDSLRGEAVKAFIVLKDKNKNPGAEAIKAFCKSQLVPYKVPRLIEFRDELPKTLVGKVLRRKLREEEEEKARAQLSTSSKTT